MSIKKMLQHIPKNRGFKSDKPKNQAVGLSSINTTFKNGGKVNPASLLKAGLIGKIDAPVKILGKDELTIKDLVFENVLMSASAKEQIEKMGGRLIS